MNFSDCMLHTKVAIFLNDNLTNSTLLIIAIMNYYLHFFLMFFTKKWVVWSILRRWKRKSSLFILSLFIFSTFGSKNLFTVKEPFVFFIHLLSSTLWYVHFVWCNMIHKVLFLFLLFILCIVPSDAIIVHFKNQTQERLPSVYTTVGKAPSNNNNYNIINNISNYYYVIYIPIYYL